MASRQIKPDEMTNQVGLKLPPGDWYEITQAGIDAFANCTDDFQFIHVDKEAAEKTPLGGTIAHGFLTLALLTRLCRNNTIYPEGLVMALNYGLDKVRFLTPVRTGKRLRAHSEIVSVERKDNNRFLVKQAVTIEIEDEETPALYAEWLGMSVID